MKKYVAGFFTGGYTELHELPEFFKKINPDLNIRQICPHTDKKSKQDILSRNCATVQIDNSHSGLTGDALIEYICDFVKKEAFHREQYDAILIEDDKDDRFLTITKDGHSEIDSVAWNTFKVDTSKKIHQAIRESLSDSQDDISDIPIIFFWAAPEIEMWMIADWSNGFGSIFNDVSLHRKTIQQLEHEFKRTVNQTILTPYYQNAFEAYGYFNGHYVKLSEEIQHSIVAPDGFLPRVLPPESGFDYSSIRYSKKTTGGVLLSRILPQNVLTHCNFFFKEGYHELTVL